MLKNTVLHPASVRSVLQQHIEDAAFYWLRRQDGLWKPAFKINQVMHLDQLLDAHLEGVFHGGQPAIEISLDRLQQWKTADEAFVSTYALLYCPEQNALPSLEALIDHDSARGAAAALLWGDVFIVEGFAEEWWQREHAPLRQAAVPLLFHRHHLSEPWVNQAIQDPCAAVRARMYKMIGEFGLQQYLSLVMAGLKESDLHCRFEAASALYLLGEDSVDATLVRDAIAQLSDFTQRRAVLLWASMANDIEFDTWLRSQTHPRIILWAIAFRGKSNYLPQLCEYLKQNIEPKLTGYVISHLTGLDLNKENFWISLEDDQEEDDLESEKAYAEDDGLLIPDAEKVLYWLEQHSKNFLPTERYLQGQPLANIAEQAYRNGYQPQRWQAAVYLARQQNKPALSTLRQVKDLFR